MIEGNGKYGEIEIGLLRFASDTIEMELRVNDPDSQGELAPVPGQANITPVTLLEELFALQNDPDEPVESYVEPVKSKRSGNALFLIFPSGGSLEVKGAGSS